MKSLRTAIHCSPHFDEAVFIFAYSMCVHPLNSDLCDCRCHLSALSKNHIKRLAQEKDVPASRVMEDYYRSDLFFFFFLLGVKTYYGDGRRT